MSKSGIQKFLAENIIIATIFILAAVDTILVAVFQTKKEIILITDLIIVFGVTFFHFDDKLEKLERKYKALSDKLNRLNKRAVTQFGAVILIILVIMLVATLYGSPIMYQTVIPPNISSNLTNLTAIIP